MANPRRFRCADNLRRLLAAGCAALVFALGLFAANPFLHAQLHRDLGATSDDGCTVVLFANGISVPVDAIGVLPPSTEWRDQRHVSSAEILLDSPRYLLQPGRGPPVG